MSVCYPQSGEDGFILHPNHAFPHGCWWEVKSKHKYLSYLFSTSWSREGNSSPPLISVAKPEKICLWCTFVFPNFTILDYLLVKCTWNQFSVLVLKAMQLFLPLLLWSLCGHFSVQGFFWFCFNLGCSAQLSKWHLRDLNVVLTNNSPTFDPSSFFIIEQIFFLLILVVSTRGVQGQGEGFDAQFLYTVIIQIGAHPRFLLEWLQLPVCTNYVFTRQITHLDCLWGPNLKFAKN